MTAYLSYAKDPRGVVTVTLNRPEKHNAFDDQFISDMRGAFALAKTQQARVVVLNATGKNFSAGADLGWMKRMATCSREENYTDALALAALMHELDALPMPTLAVVRGAAYGGAVGLACCCDIVLASDTARFCLSEARLGLAPAAISPFVVRAMGMRQARRWFQTTEEIAALTARELGIAHEVVADDQLEHQAEAMIARLLKNGPLAMQACKTLIAATATLSGDEQQRYTSAAIADLRVSPEGQEGLQAFFDKRAPSWVIDNGSAS